MKNEIFAVIATVGFCGAIIYSSCSDFEDKKADLVMFSMESTMKVLEEKNDRKNIFETKNIEDLVKEEKIKPSDKNFVLEEKEKSYTVKKGDTLSDIALTYNVTLDSLMLNNLEIQNPHEIYPGQKLVIPDGKNIEFEKRYAVDIPEGYKLWKKVECTLTAYTPTGKGLMHGGKKNWEDGKTSTGKDAFVYNGVAVDPDIIPYKTMVFIPGVGMKVADDTGGRMRRAGRRGEFHIDIRTSSYSRAMDFGRRKSFVYLFLNKETTR